MIRHNNVFKDVYREVGILEVFVGCLVKYSGYLQKHVDVDSGTHDIALTNEAEIENGKLTCISFEKLLTIILLDFRSQRTIR